MIVVDTNVVSELMRPAPTPLVVTWMQQQSGADLYTTSITLAEILYGLARLPDGKRTDRLRTAASEIFSAFADRVLAFDAGASAHFARIVRGRDEVGLPIDGFDAQIAAVCAEHAASLATRNVKDLQHTNVPLIDPWQSR